MNKFKDVFEGNERLVITFWIWGFLGSLVYGIIVILLLGFFGVTSPMVLSIAQLPWLIFIWVGIWRSSNNYQGASHWALISKGLVILGVLFTVYGFFNPVEMPSF